VAISFVGSASTPTDNSTNTTDPTSITPVGGMQNGDLCIMQAVARVNGLTITISNSGGQSWTTEGSTASALVPGTLTMFWCVFNGTWSANPSVNFGSTTCNTVVMQVFRLSDSDHSWALDQAHLFGSYSATLTPTQATFTTHAISTVTMVTWASAAANTWSSLTAGWSYAFSSGNQVRDTSGSGMSTSAAYIIKTATNSAIGNVSNTQSASTAGLVTRIIFHEVPKITLFGSASTPADNSTNTADPTAVTPPASMQDGDLVVMFALARVAGLTMTISASGGQSWNSGTQRSTTNLSMRMFWCRFNGTWGANPSVSFGSTTCNTVVMQVFRPNIVSDAWSVSAGDASNTFIGGTTPTITGITPIDNSVVTVACWGTTGSAGTFSNPLPGWSQAGTAQYRNTSGSGMTGAVAYILDGPNASGNVQQTVSPTAAAGMGIIVSFADNARAVSDEESLPDWMMAIVQGPIAMPELVGVDIEMPAPPLPDEPDIVLAPSTPTWTVPPQVGDADEVPSPHLEDEGVVIVYAAPSDAWVVEAPPVSAEDAPPSPHLEDEGVVIVYAAPSDAWVLEAPAVSAEDAPPAAHLEDEGQWRFQVREDGVLAPLEAVYVDVSGGFAPPGKHFPWWYPFSQDKIRAATYPIWYPFKILYLGPT
jgi:hypothetical protein